MGGTTARRRTLDVAALTADLADRHGVPGLAVGVLSGGEPRLHGAGVTSTRDPLPVTPDTLFLIGSTTKTLTATALMTQVQAGRVGLDDLVVDALPELRLADPDVPGVLTVRMLLDHTAGWRGDGAVDTGWGEDALARAVADVLPAEPQLRAPGTAVSYNNSAFVLAGRLLEVVTGREYGAAVRELVLGPLGMDSTAFLPWEVAGRRCAVGHLPPAAGGDPVPGWPITRASGPAGGAVSTLADQLTWAAWCLDGSTSGTSPLSQENRLQMQSPSASCRSTITGVGLSWLLQRRGDLDLVTHGGNVSNLQLGTFVLAPEQGTAVVVLSNARGGAEAGRELVDEVLGTAPPLATQSAPTGAAGRYDAGAWELHVTQDGDRLGVQMVLPDGLPDVLRQLFDRPPAEVAHVGDDLLVDLARPGEVAGDLGRDADGAVQWLRWGMRIAPRMDDRAPA